MKRKNDIFLDTNLNVISYKKHKELQLNNNIQNHLNNNNNNKIIQFQEILKLGKCCYDKLDKLFIKGGNYIFYVHDEPICGTVTSTTYERGFFPCFCVTYAYYAYSNKKNCITREHKSMYINYYANSLSLEEVKCEILTEEMKIRLTERGDKYLKYCRNFHHVDYQGRILLTAKWWSTEKLLTKGRIMIDHSYYEENESIYHNLTEYESFDNENIPKHKLDAFLGCFDLTKHRKWGLCVVENILDIEFNDDAFTYLTLTETLNIGEKTLQIKNFVKDLVKSKKLVDFDDMIEGKSCGMIFLLHGPPGVGKTLTAEATAEILHMPLYYLSAGDLGSKAHEIEKRLQNVLDLTKRWNAIILIDEADVFLEKRETSNLERNAIVSIFLKYLESHTGIVFLTSNRVKNLDNAFLSRISLVINYTEFTTEIRKEIWINLLRASSIDPTAIDVDLFTKYTLNGRQIKNIIKLAICITESENNENNDKKNSEEKNIYFTSSIISLCEYFEKNHKSYDSTNYC